MKIEGFGKLYKLEKLRKNKNLKNLETSSTNNKSDEVSISKAAQNLFTIQENIETLSKDLKNISDIRPEKVDLARKRIREKYYDKPEVKKEIANKLMNFFKIDFGE